MRLSTILSSGCASILCLAACVASAADYPVLRGSQIDTAPPAPLFDTGTTNWTGFYVGGFGGYSDTNFGTGRSAANLVANYLRSTTIEAEMQASQLLNIPDFAKRSTTFGGFVGYNHQIGDIVLGLEADYSRYDASGSASDTIARSRLTSDGYISSVDLTGRVAARLDEVFTIRGRAGYQVGIFMPYLTGGLAIGRGTVTSSATVIASGVDADPTEAPFLQSYSVNSGLLVSSRKNSTMLGGTVGGGVEMLVGGLLVRAEGLYTRMEAQGNVVIENTTGRVGAGVKF